MTDIAVLRTRLAEAEAAQHDLLIGKRVVEVMRDGRRVSYDKSSSASLDGYVQSLRLAISDAELVLVGDLRTRRRSIGFVYGA